MQIPPNANESAFTATCTLRDAREDDLPAIVEIYNASIPGRLATADTQPVTVEARRPWFQDRDWSRYPIWVIEEGAKASQGACEAAPAGSSSPDSSVVAWLSFGKFYGRPAYAATAEVSIYVAPVAHRRGHAARLIAHAIQEAPRLGLTTLLGFVFAHNQPSIALCMRFGFASWGHLPRVAVLDGVEKDLQILGLRPTSATPIE